MEPTGGSVEELIGSVAPRVRQEDARTMLTLMRRATGEEPELWGRIIGFGSYHYRYETGREGDAPAVAYAARRQATTVYLPDGLGVHAEALTTLGAHSTGVCCLYLPRLDQVDLAVLEQIIADSFNTVTAGSFGQRAREGGSTTAS
ncbi:DUF1801 domain-containing protein [Nesterenkonia sp. Act20]|uniref:DUF1801 domain-containing protein n=1 Tax=Nesterenkonia sp. Act20 TaxID=1483432 RepID=UPI001C46B679|nr:DUF1801 domain-containing protein [Nesterenkonia sp. Act20]